MRHLPRRIWAAIVLLAVFLFELIVSCLRVAVDILKPRFTMTPAVVAVPLTVRTDVQITLLANMVTLTPGTVSIDVAKDRSCLYVHAMYGLDPEAVRRSIQHTFERRILAVFG